MGFVSDFVGDLTGANQQAEAVQQASQTQANASAEAIAEQRRQFDKMIELMLPFVTGGQTASTAQQNLIGLGGQNAQQQAITALQNSPMFTSLVKQGENAILQNASATGGLRGGNTQNALSNFRGNLLNSMIQQQYSNLGGLSSLGQASAAGQASAGMNMASNIGNLLGQQAQAVAGGQLAAGQNAYNQRQGLLQLGGSLLGGLF